MKKTTTIKLGLLAAIAAAAIPQVQATQVCNHYDKVTMGKYVLLNNMWNKSESPNGWQCVENYNTTSPLSFGFYYNWPQNGKPYTVKAYPSMVIGWQYGFATSGANLPARIWENHNISTTGNTSITNAGVQNAAYDLWFHNTGSPGVNQEPTDELMVWTSTWGGANPLGSYQNDATIAGTTWAVWKGSVGARGVYTFKRKSNTSSWSYNLKDFIHYVVYTKSWMSNSKYLTGVQYGVEPFSTNGQTNFSVSNYKADVYK
jgi:hypothetical protein